MTNDKIKGELLALAAEMVLGKGLPSSFVEDYQWPKTTPIAAIRIFSKALEQMDRTKADWTYRIRDISEHLK